MASRQDLCRFSRFRCVLIIGAVLALSCFACTSPHVVLIGTSHGTPVDRISEVEPIRKAILDFKPDAICAEYLLPSDSTSLKYFYDDDYFERTEQLRIKWSCLWVVPT